MLARKIIESLNVSPIYFIVAFNLSQNLSLIAGICIYDCKPIQLTLTKNFNEGMPLKLPWLAKRSFFDLIFKKLV
jgi:hypothetical protein